MTYTQEAYHRKSATNATHDTQQANARGLAQEIKAHLQGAKHQVQALLHVSEHDVLAVQPRGLSLRTARLQW